MGAGWVVPTYTVKEHTMILGDARAGKRKQITSNKYTYNPTHTDLAPAAA